MGTRTQTSWTTWLLIAACLLAFVARFFPWSIVFQDGQVFFFADDCHYHMRRILLIIAHFPRIPLFESYMSYPEGAYCVWPPLFDFGIALLALIAGLGHPSQHLTEVLAAFVPPALGALTLPPVYLIARSLAGRTVGLLAAFLLVLIPGHVACSVLGRVDHHVAEAFLFAWASWFLISGFSSRKAARSLRFAAAGALIGMLFLVQSASLVYAAVLFAFVAAQCAADFGSEDASGICLGPALAFALAAAIILPFAAAAPDRASLSAPFMGLSWFHVVIAAGAAGFFLISSGLAKMGLHRGWRCVLNLVLAALVQGIALLGLCALFPGLAEKFRTGAEFLFRKGAYARIITESMPLFIPQGREGNGFTPGMLLTYAVYIVPLVLVWALVEKPKDQRRFSAPRTFFLVATLGMGALTLLQRRFAQVFALNVSIVFAYLLAGIAQKLGSLTRRAVPLAWIWLIPRIVGWAAAACVFLLLAWPALTYLRIPAEERYLAISPDVYRSLQWMRDNTPRTSFYNDPRHRPEYGVLCEWDKGHWIEYVAHRPVVANNFCTLASEEAFMDSVRFFYTESESKAVEIAQRRRVRFVVTTPLSVNVCYNYCLLLGVNPSRYVVSNPKSDDILSFNFSSYRLMGPHLHEADGLTIRLSESSKAVLADQLERFRLVYEAPPGSREFIGANPIPLKIFEFVAGARVCGKGIPNESVSAHAFLKTNTGRRFEYKALDQCAPDGTFSILIPYPTRNPSYPVQTEGDFDVACGPLSGRAAIAEAAVQRGATVQVALTPTRPKQIGGL